MNDLRFALRQLRKSPGFTFLALLTLAVGIGMNTAIFSLIQDLFLRGLPFSEPERVVRIYGESKERDLKQMPSSVPKFWHYRDGQTVFSSIAADWGNGFIMTGSGEPIQLLGGNVTANYFELLGIHPILGRNFLPEEESKGDVVMVTENFWRKRFASDPTILGHNITLNGVPTTIIGVLPNLPISWFGRDSEIFVNKPFEPSGITKDRLMRGVSFMRVTARLKPGVSVSQAQAAMPALLQSYKEQHPETADNTWSPYLVSAAEDVTGDLRPAFLTLLAAVSAVLLIACSNVANLLLVRFTGRKREIALRMALGAERRGIVRLFVFESTLVSVIAGMIGLGLALWTVSVVPKLAGQNIPLESGVKLQLPVLIFTLGLSLITGLLMGLYPAWQSSRADLVDGLKEGGRGTSGSRGQHRFRRGLVAGQVGLSVVLLAGAGMLVSSFVRLSRQEPGFRSERVWAGGIGLPPAQYPDPATRGRFAERLQTELQTAPGVEAAAIADAVPLSGNSSRSPYARADGNPVPVNQRQLGLTRSVSPGYFRTLGISLLSGRDFTEQDKVDSRLVVILSNSTAKKLFPNENPIGHQILFGTDNGNGLPAEVIGVVGDVRSQQLSKANDVEFYRPWPQRSAPFLNVVVRSATKPEATAGIVRAALNKIDNGLPILQPSTLDAIVTQSLGQERLTMTLLGVFAGIALLLAVVGIYGAVAYTVEQRTGEIGVRMALGAQTHDVLNLVVRQGMNPVILGLIFGLAGTFAVGRLLAAQLYQISPYDPLLLGATAIVLAVAALLACLIPARRATLVDPIQALRSE
ncbi:MAG: MacB-like periplasmic core domain protein [Candidatus Udaeobacter sp.]|nr:MAG: MacB-like periplasmic core domain protein [Candidatus Udaeobacter sp.]